VNNGGCDPNSACAHDGGDYTVITCTCNTGYVNTGIGSGLLVVCTDACNVDNGGCGTNATCSHDIFSYAVMCACNGGYADSDPGPATVCVDACTVNNGGCDANATCAHDAGNYATITCTCNTGYVNTGIGNGLLVVCTAPSVTSVTPTTAMVATGTTFNATVTLDLAAPTGGIVVALSSDATARATVPASVTVPATQTSAEFTITAGATLGDATITATAGGSSRTIVITTIAKPALTSLNTTTPDVAAGAPVTVTVTISSAAPTGGTAVTLSSGNPAVTVPASATVLEGATTVDFVATTSSADPALNAVVTGTLDSVPQTVTINSYKVSGVTLAPAVIAKGVARDLTVTLDHAVPALGSVPVQVSSGSGDLTLAADHVDVAGSAAATIAGTGVNLTAGVLVTATLGSSTAQLNVRVSPALTTASFPASEIAVGDDIVFTVNFSEAALGGESVTASSDIEAASVVSCALAVASATNTACLIHGASAGGPATITAALGGTTASAPVTVRAVKVVSLLPANVTVDCGATAAMTVTLNAAAPSGGIEVGLSSAAPTSVSVPTSVMVVEGDTSALFNVTGGAVAGGPVAVTAHYVTDATAQVTVSGTSCP